MEQCLCIAFIHLLIYLLRGSLGFAVLQYWTMFFCGVSEILLSKCGIVIFSEPAGCVFFLAILMVLNIILLVCQHFPSLFPFPMKLSSHGNGNCVHNFLCRKKGYANVCYCFLFKSKIESKLPDLMFINKFVILISVLFAVN